MRAGPSPTFRICCHYFWVRTANLRVDSKSYPHLLIRYTTGGGDRCLRGCLGHYSPGGSSGVLSGQKEEGEESEAGQQHPPLALLSWLLELDITVDYKQSQHPICLI